MLNGRLTIGFVRRGYSPSGGAEMYLKRLARGVVHHGHEARLVTTGAWGSEEWPFGPIIRSHARSAMAFADDLERLRAQVRCDAWMSLERVWRCDVYRAGDGVHRAWLERREEFATPIETFVRAFNRKHRDLLRLEKALLADRAAGRVIANSQMVKNEIVDLYGYPAEKIDIIRNGVPLERFRFSGEFRAKARADLDLGSEETALLFVGSGWERKGLRFALEAVEACNNPNTRLLVAGRGNARTFRSSRVQCLGELADPAPAYAASDILILPTIYDPFSNACLEALASGLPVITTRANGFSEIIEHGVHGSIVDLANDIAGLREAIQLWSDPCRRAAARPIIIERASEFDISKNVEQTLAVLIQTTQIQAPASAESISGKIRKT